MAGSRIASFFHGERGNLSITTGLVGVMLMTAAGAAMDGGRMITTKQRLQSVSDAAALMAAMPDDASTQERRATAQTSIRNHISRRGDIELSRADVSVTNGGSAVTVELAAEVPMLFGAFLGGNTRLVAVRSRAEESVSASMNPLSISVVLDLSESMSERFDTGSRLAAVRAALTDTLRAVSGRFGGEAAAQSQLSLGLYPFNWGRVADETVSLEPGTEGILDALTFIGVDDGSVATTAWEMALQEQIDARSSEGDRDRYILYITDGGVDDEKDDQRGRMLDEDDVFNKDGTPQCNAALDDLEKAERELLKHYDKLVDKHGRYDDDNDNDDDDDDDDDDGRSVSALLPGISFATPALSGATLSQASGELLSRLLGAGQNECGHIKKVQSEKASLDKALDAVILACEPKQTMRVVTACEQAREEGISVIAVDVSGQDDGEAERIADLCVLGPDGEDTEEAGERTREGNERDRESRAGQGGFELTLSADGTSMSASVSNLKELREVLATMLPDAGKPERVVRLVH
ncbi:MAG: pilus assembly protein [Litorimonas sp.]